MAGAGGCLRERAAGGWGWGAGGRNATEMGSGLTWLWIKSIQTWAGSSWGSSWIQAPEDVFFLRIVGNSDLWIPSMVSGVAENSPRHVSLLLFY